jgi:hypothetical protein
MPSVTINGSWINCDATSREERYGNYTSFGKNLGHTLALWLLMMHDFARNL